MSIPISVDEWMAELQRLSSQSGGDNALTNEDICNRMGCCAKTAQRIIKKAVSSGEWESVQVVRTRVNGVLAKTWGYRPKRSA